MRLLPLLALAACTKSPCPGLEADPQALTWLDVAVGEVGALPLALENSCPDAAIDVSLRLEAAPGFAIAATSVEIEAGGRSSVDLTFAPLDTLVHRGTLFVQAEGVDTIEISLQGAGLAVDTDPEDTDVGDADGDGFDSPEDCDDADDSVFPNAPEAEDGVDDDCDGLVDENFARAGELSIVEVMVDPVAVADATGQWLEVVVTGSRSVDLKGWTFTTAEGSWSVPNAIVVDPGERAVFAASADSTANGGVVPQSVYASMPLTSFVALSSSDGSLIHRLDWTSWSLTPGVSLSLAPGREADADEESAWCRSLSIMSGGDRGTPNAVNDACFDDGDGDGWTVPEGDCDDLEARAYPGATEVWGDLVDNDCDGAGDKGTIDAVKSGTLDGSTRTTPDYLGYRSNLGVGDLDGDGKNELIAASWHGWDDMGVVYVIDGAGYASWSGAASAKAQATIHGVGTQQRLGAVGSGVADATGDGKADLVVAGHDGYGGHAVALFAGPITGTLTDTNAKLTMSGSESADRADVQGALDLDGDGVAELVYGEGRAHVSGTYEYDGRVAVLVSDGRSGDVAVEDSDTVWRGEADYDYFGESLGGGDLDGDGRDDLVIGAWGQDGGTDSGGAVYLVHGAAGLWSGGSIAADADATIEGHVSYRRVGSGAEPVVRDLDGDGSLDLAIGAWEDRKAHVFFDVGALSGAVSTASSDVAIAGDVVPGEFSLGLTAGDFDGDGLFELAAGAPDDEQKTPWTSGATNIGAVYVFAVGDLLGSGALKDSLATITGAAATDGFGQTLIAGDLDGDGDDELVIGAPGYGTGLGRIYVVGW